MQCNSTESARVIMKLCNRSCLLCYTLYLPMMLQFLVCTVRRLFPVFPYTAQGSDTRRNRIWVVCVFYYWLSINNFVLSTVFGDVNLLIGSKKFTPPRCKKVDKGCTLEFIPPLNNDVNLCEFSFYVIAKASETVWEVQMCRPVWHVSEQYGVYVQTKEVV